MKSFTTRVELHDATARQDYDTLHAAMASEGFHQAIVGNNGVTYHLPTAEYDFVGEHTIEQVREKARRAAASTGKNSAVFVTEAVQRAWIGLTPVRKAA